MKFRMLAAAVVAAISAVPCLAAGISPVGPVFAFANNQIEGISAPAAAMRADGSFIVAWSNGGNVLMQRYANGGTPLGARITVFSTSGESLLNRPRLSMNAAGDFAVIAVFSDGQDGQGLARVYRADGTPIGAAFRFDDAAHSTNISGTSYAAALNAADQPLIAWVGTAPGLKQLGLYHRRYTATGTALDALPQQIVGGLVPTGQNSVSAGIADDGHYLLTWGTALDLCYVPPGAVGCGVEVEPRTVHFRQLDSSGKPKGAVGTVFAAATLDYTHEELPVAAMNSSGEFAVAWAKGSQQTTNSVHSQAYSAAGVLRSGGGSDFPPGTACCFNGLGPLLAIDAAGDYILALNASLRIYIAGSGGAMTPLGPESSATIGQITGIASDAGKQFVVVNDNGLGQIYSFSK